MKTVFCQFCVLRKTSDCEKIDWDLFYWLCAARPTPAGHAEQCQECCNQQLDQQAIFAQKDDLKGSKPPSKIAR